MKSPKKWLKLTLSCPQKMSESLSDLMVVLSGSGVDIHPVPDSRDTEITGFFPFEAGSGTDIQQRVNRECMDLFAIYNEPMPEPVTEIIDDQDWATNWQQYFKAFEIIPGLIIKPSWEEYLPSKGQFIIEMDPGMAFGTGQHESTKMALLLISKCLADPVKTVRTILDVGTGTGILAMAAARMGGERIIGVDNDPDAVTVAMENVKANNLDDRIRISGTPVTDLDGPFDLICANIVHDVLVGMAPEFERLLVPGGHVILSGILGGEQENNIEKVYASLGLHLVRSEHENEWASLHLEKPAANI